MSEGGLVRLFSSKSGFRNVRDLLFFVAGLTICFYHFFTTPAADLSIPVMIFGGGMAGAPIVMRQDEKKKE